MKLKMRSVIANTHGISESFGPCCWNLSSSCFQVIDDSMTSDDFFTSSLLHFLQLNVTGWSHKDLRLFEVVHILFSHLSFRHIYVWDFQWPGWLSTLSSMVGGGVNRSINLNLKPSDDFANEPTALHCALSARFSVRATHYSQNLLSANFHQALKNTWIPVFHDVSFWEPNTWLVCIHAFVKRTARSLWGLGAMFVHKRREDEAWNLTRCARKKKTESSRILCGSCTMC